MPITRLFDDAMVAVNVSLVPPWVVTAVAA